MNNNVSCAGPHIVPPVPNTLAVGSIELGELSCDSLDNVLDSTLLRFTINSNQVKASFAAWGKRIESGTRVLIDDGSTLANALFTLPQTLITNLLNTFFPRFVRFVAYRVCRR